MIEETRLPDSVMAELGDLIPGSEPHLEVRIPRIPVAEEEIGRRIIPVSDPKLDGNELRYLTPCVETNWISSAGQLRPAIREAVRRGDGMRVRGCLPERHRSVASGAGDAGVGPGDEVIIPTFTMIATANAVAYTGATPVLVDSEPISWNMDTSQVAAKITPRTRGIVLMHTYGHPVDMDPLPDLAERRGLWVLEDAAEAHGAQYRGRAVGSLGSAACFSFYANKIITTGEGGMVTTNDAELARWCAGCGTMLSRTSATSGTSTSASTTA